MEKWKRVRDIRREKRRKGCEEEREIGTNKKREGERERGGKIKRYILNKRE